MSTQGKTIVVFISILLAILFIWGAIFSNSIWLPALGSSISYFWDKNWIVILSAIGGMLILLGFQAFINRKKK